MYVTEVGRELGKLALYIKTCAIPGNETGSCEVMPQVMKPWSTARAASRRRFAQTDCARHLCEGPLRHCVPDASASLSYEEGIGDAASHDAVTDAGVAHEHLSCGVMKRDEAGLAELRLAHAQDARAEIHVGQIKGKRFAEPQAAGRKQSKERSKGRPPQPGRRRQ